VSIRVLERIGFVCSAIPGQDGRAMGLLPVFFGMAAVDSSVKC
jgi:hypothetical protein